VKRIGIEGPLQLFRLCANELWRTSLQMLCVWACIFCNSHLEHMQVIMSYWGLYPLTLKDSIVYISMLWRLEFKSCNFWLPAFVEMSVFWIETNTNCMNLLIFCVLFSQNSSMRKSCPIMNVLIRTLAVSGKSTLHVWSCWADSAWFVA
jgi:hypothetical protein